LHDETANAAPPIIAVDANADVLKKRRREILFLSSIEL